MTAEAFTLASPAPDRWHFADDGTIPNHPHYPVLRYRGVTDRSGEDAAAFFEALFDRNGWPPQWRDTVYGTTHFHSTAHEVLGIARGRARVQLGGDHGRSVELETGDVLILPAGTGHRRLDGSDDLLVVGGYPAGQQWDMQVDESEGQAAVQGRIAAVPHPAADPVGGPRGALMTLWRDPAPVENGQPCAREFREGRGRICEPD